MTSTAGLATEALELASIVYGAFLEKSDPIIKHGVSAQAHELMAKYMDEHHR